MLDIKFIRENKELIAQGAQKKRIKFDVEALISLDTERRDLLSKVENQRAEQNAATEKISQTQDPAERTRLIDSMKVVKETMQADEEKLKEVMKKWQALMLEVPNIPDISVPEGESDADNREERVWGTQPVMNFEPKDHIEIMEKLDIVDFERGVKVAGFRGYFLKGLGAQLELAVWNLAVEMLTRKGYQFIIAPSRVRRESFVGTGMIPQSEDDLYKVGENEYLAGTAEVPTMGYHMNETLAATDLPKKYLAFSPCFRAEAGKHGKDVKGLIRVHEFFKMEQVILCEASHTESVRLHEELTQNAEEIMQALKLHYHVVVNCGADLGLGQVKKYDIEAWMPSQKKFRETHSSSYFHDFQTRRLNIRYKDAEGKVRYTHSLNNTAVATPRILACIIENYQQADGSVIIPEVLRPYMGGATVIAPRTI